MSKISLNEFAGLVTAPGLLQRNPASCIESVNWEFPAPGIIRKRRGFARQTGNAGGPVWQLMTSRLMGANVLAHIGSTTVATQIRYGDGSAALTAIPTIDGGTLTRDPQDTRMKLAVCQRDHYLTADEGVARLESDFASGSSARYAGMPRGQGLRSVTIATSVFANFAVGKARAYRVTWHRKDADGVELGGAPSSRFVIANAAYEPGYAAVATDFGFSFRIPMEFGTKATALTTSYYWRLWGTRQFTEASELGDDEMHLIAEAYLTAGNLAVGYVLYSDGTPDSFLLSAPSLHTNLSNFPPSEVGIRQGLVNEDAPPPVANDIAYWQDVMWYADCFSRPGITVGLISALANNDTITVTANGVTLAVTAKTVPGAASEFQIVTTGATNAINIRETVAYLVDCLNKNAVSGFTAHAITTNSTQPGLMYLELSNLATATTQPLNFTSSVTSKWAGFDGYKIASDVLSTEQSNLLRFSKPLRADAVPPINVLSVGNADSRILRVMPFRDRMLVFTDAGIYQVTGRTFADFSVFPFDLGYRLMGRELVAMCDEKVYAWCNEGIIEIDDGGVTVVSQSIEPTIEAAIVTAAGGSAGALLVGRTAIGQFGFATAYRNQHQVRFHYCEEAAANCSAYWFAFDTRTRTWTQGDFGSKTIGGLLDGRCCSVVRFSDDLLVGGSWSSGADTYLFLERRDYTATDYADDDRTGGSAAIESTLTLQYQLPDEQGAQHWQQTSFSWETAEQQWKSIPSLVSVTHATEETAATQGVTVLSSSTRIEPGDSERRGQRMQVTLVHAVAEYAGIVAVSQAYRPGSRFARGVTP